MTKKYIDNKKVAVVLKIAAYAIEDNDADGMTLNDVYNLLDNAFRTVLGDKTFDELKETYLFDDDDDDDDDGWVETDKNGKVVDASDDPETPKF